MGRADRRPRRSASDWAYVELRTRDVFSTRPPLIGAFSRYGWAHPGPAPFYAMALPYRLLGADAAAMRMSALLVNSAVIAVTIWLLSRRGRAVLAAGLVALAATVWALPPLSITDSWNPTIAVMPLLLTIVACWAALCGDGPALPVAVVAALFVLHAHVGFGVVVAPVVMATVAVALWRAMRRGGPRRPLAFAFAAAVVMSIPILVDIATAWPGNIGRLVRWSLSNDVNSAGIGRSVGIVLRQASLTYLADPQLPVFVATVADPLPGTVLLGVLLGALALALWGMRRADRRAELTLLAVIAGVWISGVVAGANVRGPQHAWLHASSTGAGSGPWSRRTCVSNSVRTASWTVDQGAGSSSGPSTGRSRRRSARRSCR